MTALITPRLPAPPLDEAALLASLAPLGPDPAQRAAAAARGAKLVRDIRGSARPGLMEMFLAEYGLSTAEGLALMTLAEAMLRVPDAATADALIADKIGGGDWSSHRGGSTSRLVNVATEGLRLTRGVLGDEDSGVLRAATRRLGAPVIRVAVGRAMREMGDAFVLGRDIDEALRRGREARAQGFTHSYDMLGEAATSAADAERFRADYAGAIARLATETTSSDIRDNPGISIKLSALHPRYQTSQVDRVRDELVPIVTDLARAAAAAGMGLNIDAEEQSRLELSLDLIETVLSDPQLAGWDGFGVVVQGYGTRAMAVVDWLDALSLRLGRRIMVRLVKGAYWDTEIKRAQVEGLAGFPVFTRKAATDVAWLACAGRLLQLTDRIYPQFATHNAASVAAVLEMTTDRKGFEFQRLHGMGEALHRIVHEAEGTRCRIYAPVGPHEHLLAYLARRMLENGANSSFVNQVVDPKIAPETVTEDPARRLAAAPGFPGVDPAAALYLPGRRNSEGVDLLEPHDLNATLRDRDAFAAHRWQAGPLLAPDAERAAQGAADEAADGAAGTGSATLHNPARPDDAVGNIRLATPQQAQAALAAARPWAAEVAERARILVAASDLYEARRGEIFALLAREAGKSLIDAQGELREAVDFLRYYAAEAQAAGDSAPAGVFSAISPWNFPLAIFTGQIAGALAAGNAVLAKPAEATPLIAHLAVQLMHEAGVPRDALQLLPGEGKALGPVLTGDARVNGVVFTGSTATAQTINRSMAAGLDPSARLIAETGGLNAMIVDSTALPEQVVRDVLTSAFQSAGQRCSALRCLYIQRDVEATILPMLFGAMDELRIGDPWDPATDVGPVIDATAREGILAHLAAATAEGRILKQVPAPETGHFVAPSVIRVGGIADLKREVFGPVLHVASFAAGELDAVVAAINASGYGLTFGLHSRIGGRTEAVAGAIHAGNVYVNRNQIGAVVGVQPFGGEGLSGTGPKAGGPAYVPAFRKSEPLPVVAAAPSGTPNADAAALARRVAEARKRLDDLPVETAELPGPTGERNTLTRHGRGVVLCLGPDSAAQARQAQAAGSVAVTLDGAGLDPAVLQDLPGIDAVAFRGAADEARAIRRALAARAGAIVPLLGDADITQRCRLERHVCVDTTAAGGNATLLAEVG